MTSKATPPGSIVNHAQHTCPQIEPLMRVETCPGEEPEFIKMELLQIKHNMYMFPYVENYLVMLNITASGSDTLRCL